jgi:hypothetical protein
MRINSQSAPAWGPGVRVLGFAALAFIFMSLNAVPAYATTYQSGLSYIGEDATAQRCYYHQALARVPSNAGGYALDFNAFIYKKVRSPVSGCSTGAAGANFNNGEAFVQAYLLKTSDASVCSSTSGYQPTGYPSFGVGKAYNPSSPCSGVKNFQNESDVGVTMSWGLQLAYISVNFSIP